MKQGWEIKKLGEVCETSSGGTPSKTHKEYYEGGNIPWLRSGEVSQGLIYDTELYITTEGLDNSSAKIFPIDTVVIAMYGATVGQVGILKRAMPTNQAVCGIFPTTTFEPLFLVYYLKAKKPYYLSMAAGGAQPNISQQIKRDTYIPIPSREEQERIVAELDCLSGVIEKKREQLRELDALAQSIFYQMFGDPITNEKGWEIKKVKDVAPQQEYKGDVPCVDGKYWLLNLDMVIPNTGEIIEKCYFDYDEIGNSTIIFNTDNVLYSKLRPYLNKVVIPNDIGYGTSELVPLKPHKDLLNKVFFASLLRSSYFVKYISGKVAGAKMPRVAMGEFREFAVILPPLALQQEFADKIEAIEKQKELIKQSIAETETLFNSRMDYYFN